ncbi:BREX system P-loop protein BrxC [Companilactobacillus paralimentarius]|uniref:BREX system P-loop protein BrxC n=1 Tax=Companilactobacillus paralimentarius TaxID=83526 RepID=UPI00384C4352
MIIKDIFEKPINRNIKGVITIGDEKDNNIKQELEEYVVTRELKKHFNDFFEAYVNSIGHNTTNMGVWISGFFGSGKSHFLKILSYLLENREVKGKKAINYFTDDNKITDPATIQNMEKAVEIHNEVMLFNIDSKARDNNKAQKNAILNVFLQVFNERLGLSGESFLLADLERKLIKDNRYDDFKNEFKQITGNGWVETRKGFAFMKGTIKDTLVNIGYMSDEDAQGFVNMLSSDYSISVEEFAKMVNQYIKKQSDDYHMIFLVDEIGQYIGDSQQRMLNLQSIVEDLGTYTQGKAWVIVTSQQAIDKVTDNINGQDFSKIQGRFHTRLSMSSANVDEVIKKRLLEKTSEGKEQLEDTYEAEKHSINNLIDFDGDDGELKKYDDSKEFSEVYPFVPYQFNLLQKTLTAIRENGSDGKHLAEGERSMLAVFQESAQYFENRDTDALIPYSVFFRGLEQFLDHTHEIVIQHAATNEKINPNNESKPFAVEVLETLFMVKYVKNFDATLNNVTTLMIDSINTDRIVLENKVKKALAILINQGLIEKTIHGYEFLTDAEQDISKQISKQNVDSGEISQNIGDQLFTSNNISKRLVYPKLNNQYTFAFNTYIDDYPNGSTNSEMSIKVNTPESDYHHDEDELIRLSIDPTQPPIIIDMPEEDSYIDDIRQMLKIRKFARDNNNQLSDARSKEIINVKVSESGVLANNASKELMDALQQADIYISGKKLDNNGKDFFKRLKDAEVELIDEVYRNLSYIEVTRNEKDIVSLFKNDGLNLKTDENSQAVQAVMDNVTRSFDGRNKISYKSILDKFSKIPYGYKDIDIKWLVAKLFVDAKLKLYVNNASVNIGIDTDPLTMSQYFTKKSYIDKVQFEPRREISAAKKRDVMEIADVVFNKRTFSNDEDDTVMNELKEKISSDLNNLKRNNSMPSYYPGKNLIEDGIDKFQKLLSINDADNFYDYASKEVDNLLDWHDEMEDDGIIEFYNSDSQQGIWKDAENKLNIYNNSHSFIFGSELPKVVADIKQVLSSNKPAGQVHDLKNKNEKFNEEYMKEFERQLEKMKETINVERDSTLDYARKNDFLNKMESNINKEFDEVEQEAVNSDNLDKLMVMDNKASVLGSRNKTRIDQLVLIREQEQKVVVPTDKKKDDSDKGIDDTSIEPHIVEPKPVVTPTHISLRSLSISKSWRIDDEADIDRELNRLKQVLVEELKQNKKINLDL